jgi:hypothetical protein
MATTFKNTHYVDAYRLAGDGLDNAKIADALGIRRNDFQRQVKKDKALRQALEKARKPKTGDGMNLFRDFIYDRLPRRAQKCWDALESVEKIKDEPGKRKARNAAFALIDQGPTRVRQHLFLHALVACNFMTTLACRKVGISPGEVEDWKDGDPGFAKLVTAIHQHKKDFCESALMDLVKERNASAVIFANKTLNRDRGYDAGKVTIQHEGQVAHTHDINVDDLPLDVQRGLLAVMVASKSNQLEDNRNVVDVEFVAK